MSKKEFHSPQIAIEGYDPVSFFQGQSKVGKAAYSVDMSGVTWRFVSQENLDQFKATPHTFMPQYDGNCALAMSLGQVSSGSPKSWSIDQDKLYFSGNAFAGFLFQFIPGRKAAANQHWNNHRENSTHS